MTAYKITDLTAANTVTNTDLLVVVTDPVANPVTKKLTVNALANSVISNYHIVLGSNTVPATASSNGTTGQIVSDSSYIYVCVSTNTWKRAALNTW